MGRHLRKWPPRAAPAPLPFSQRISALKYSEGYDHQIGGATYSREDPQVKITVLSRTERQITYQVDHPDIVGCLGFTPNRWRQQSVSDFFNTIRRIPKTLRRVWRRREELLEPYAAAFRLRGVPVRVEQGCVRFDTDLFMGFGVVQGAPVSDTGLFDRLLDILSQYSPIIIRRLYPAPVPQLSPAAQVIARPFIDLVVVPTDGRTVTSRVGFQTGDRTVWVDAGSTSVDFIEPYVATLPVEDAIQCIATLVDKKMS